MNRRVAAALALLLVLAVVIATVVTVIGDFPRFIAQIVLFAIFLSAGWIALTRRTAQDAAARYSVRQLEIPMQARQKSSPEAKRRMRSEP